MLPPHIPLCGYHYRSNQGVIAVNFGDQYSNSVRTTRVCFWLLADLSEDPGFSLLLGGKQIVPLIRFAVDTGGRLSELLRLDWRYVDMKNNRVRFTNTKNGEDRTVRLCDRALATLASLEPKDSGSVFTFRGKSVSSVRTAFNKARKKAGLEDVLFHDLRHTFASRLVQAGVPLYDVMHMTGHKSLEMVQRYSHLAPDYQERALEALNSLGHDSVTVNDNAATKNGITVCK